MATSSITITSSMCAAQETGGAAQLFPRCAYARAFEALLATESEKQACRTMVGAQRAICGPIFQQARRMGLEGIVSKRLGSRYRGGRSPDWLKFKNLR
jgi:hypothetical protein